MESNEHLYDLEVWHLRTKELMREADEARLAKRLRAMRRKSISNKATAAKWAFLMATLVAALMLSSGIALAATITCQVNTECLGTPEPDALEGTAAADDIFGRGAADILKGFSGGDDLYGQGGSDKLIAGSGPDGLTGGPGSDTLKGGADDDNYYFLTNNWGRDSIADSSSESWLLFAWKASVERVTDDLSINLFPGAGPEVKNASGTSTINLGSDTHITTLYSGDGDDNITGNFSPNLIDGGQGTDTISSYSGNDFIIVADGEADNVSCGSDLLGGQDYDVVYYDSLDDVSDNCEQRYLFDP